MVYGWRGAEVIRPPDCIDCVALLFRLPPPEGVEREGVRGRGWGGILVMAMTILAVTGTNNVNRYEVVK